jgi:hypothetical protein
MPEYGTSLSVTGRKIIGFNFNNKTFINPQVLNSARPRSTGVFEITQTLQIRMQGKVGPKITVNVDYDDTKPDKQDISVVYQGDPNEVVQQASFGDIDLSLPATEFVSYNKQLFGIRANLKYKSFNGILIASRTKGTTKTKEFIGNTQFQTIILPDTSYVRRQFYDLTFGGTIPLPLLPGSERVFLDQENPLQTQNTSSFTVVDRGNNTVTWQANFSLLQPGIDYTVDYQKGILTLRNPAQQQFVLAIDFITATGARLSASPGTGCVEPGSTSGPLAFEAGQPCPELIKTTNDLPITVGGAVPPGQLGFDRELKTFYSVGRSQIVRDNGRGNFILQVQDPSGNNIGNTFSPPQVYPNTITVDFEQGLIQLTNRFPQTDVYAPTPISHQVLNVQFSSRLKTFILEPTIVPQSDNVVVDGQSLTRNVDYFIDYDVGFLTFFNPDRIGPNSKIDVTYDVAPFGGIGTESLLGGRFGWAPNAHFAVGSTILYDAASRPPTVPFIDDIPKSLLVLEADTQLKDLQIFKWLKGSFGFEVAESIDNPNLNGFALIDNMEGVKQENDASLDQLQWQIAANPNGQSFSGPADPTSVGFTSFLVNKLDINPSANAAPGEQQLVLQMDYNFLPGSNETSIVFPYSPAGLDFSQKTFLEVVMQYAGNVNGPGPDMSFHLGSIDEDADSQGGMTLNCADGRTLVGAPKTEDINCDAILEPGEDIGWLYAPAGKNSARIGANNGKLNTEDLNQNGRLDGEDLSGCQAGYGATNGCPGTLFVSTNTGTPTNTISADAGFTSTVYKTIDIPLNISSATAVNWNAIRQIRISLRNNGGIATTGSIRFARIAVVGNAWQAGQMVPISTSPVVILPSTGTLTVSAVNNVDTPGYVPIFNAGGVAQQVYNDLYGSVSQQEQLTRTQNVTEQSLALQFSALLSGTTAFTEKRFQRPLDMSTHKNLRFLLYGCAPIPAPGSTAGVSCGPGAVGKTFIMRFGTDTDYWEIDLPMTRVPGPGWNLYTLDLIDTGHRGIADAMGPGSSGATVFKVGNPNMQQVGVVFLGLANNTGSQMTTADTMWVDEIHVENPLTRVGQANMARADFDVPGWMTFGGKHRYVDRNFQTPITVVTGQDNQLDNGYLNFKRISFFPMSFTGSRQQLVTPNVLATGNTSNLVNLLQQGTVVDLKGNATGSFLYGALPKLTLTYDREHTDYQDLFRVDDRKTYGWTGSYVVPGKSAWTPRTVDLNYSHSLYAVDFVSEQALTTPGNFDTLETTDNMGGKLSFAPWSGTSIQPIYSLKIIREHRTDFNQAPVLDTTYPKELDQTVGMNTSWQFAKWLKPTAAYTVTLIENNNLSTTSFVVDGSTENFNVGALKTVNRNATGSINLPISLGEIVPNSKLLRSMNIVSSYQLQDGDVWQNMDKDQPTMGALWLRTPLSPNNNVSQETNLTLRDTYSSTLRWSPLEGYDIPGRWSSFKTLGLTNNFAYSKQHTDVTGTTTDTTNKTLPDLVVTLGQVEKLLHTERWMANTLVNVKTSRQTTVTEDVSDQINKALGFDLRFMFIGKFDTAFTVNFKDSTSDDLRTGLETNDTSHQDASLQTTFSVRQWRLTPKIDYTNDTTVNGGVTASSVRVITPSILARGDLNLPAGLKLPFMSKPLIFTNRVIWTNTASLAMRRSDVTVADNSDLLNLSTNADYELATNLRMSVNGSVQRLWHKFLPEEDFLSYQLGTTLTFQF